MYCLNTCESVDIVAIATDKTIRLLQMNGQKLGLEMRGEIGSLCDIILDTQSSPSSISSSMTLISAAVHQISFVELYTFIVM